MSLLRCDRLCKSPSLVAIFMLLFPLLLLLHALFLSLLSKSSNWSLVSTRMPKDGGSAKAKVEVVLWEGWTPLVCFDLAAGAVVAFAC